MRTIDGAMGEGGGQVLRSALSLSLLTGEPVRVEHIRAGRSRPGLLRQHLLAVQAATEIGHAEVEGAALGSTEVLFKPRAIRGGDRTYRIGSAGSTSLVFETLLYPLLAADRPSELLLEGGTHNPLAPPFEFLEGCLVPLLTRMGAKVSVHLERPGYYPAGGGRLRARIEPSRLAPLELVARGPVVRRRATAVVSDLPADIAHRELLRVRERLGYSMDECRIRGGRTSSGPGNILVIDLDLDGDAGHTEIITVLGEPGLPAESVADEAADRVTEYLAAEAPVGVHLADQLLLPLALAGGGRFLATRATAHAKTQAVLIPMFLGVAIAIDERPNGTAMFTVEPRP